MAVVFIVATHGVAAKELLATSFMLLGEQEDVHAVDFVPGENAEILAEKYKAIMAQYPADTQFLFLLDLWGGSPFNAANLAAGLNPNACIVTGVSVPGLLEAFGARDEDEDLEGIAKAAVQGIRDGARATAEGQEKFKNLAPQAAAAAPSAAPSAAQSNYKGPDKRGSTVIEPWEGKDHFTIGLTRIDDRLIHGQVATVWTKVSNVSRILVVDDAVANDKVRSTMLKQSTPPGVSAHVLTVAKATRVFNNPEYAGERFMLLFTGPEPIVKLVKEAKWPLKHVNIGGISFKDGKKTLTKAVNVSQAEADAFFELADAGVELEVQVVATESKTNLLNIFKEKGVTRSK